MATEEGRTFFQEEPVCEHLSGTQDSALAKCQWLIFKEIYFGVLMVTFL